MIKEFLNTRNQLRAVLTKHVKGNPNEFWDVEALLTDIIAWYHSRNRDMDMGTFNAFLEKHTRGEK